MNRTLNTNNHNCNVERGKKKTLTNLISIYYQNKYIKKNVLSYIKKKKKQKLLKIWIQF